MAVHLTLTTISIVLAIEITFHIVNPRPEELTIMGGFLTEFILIGALVLYEWLPTLYRLDEYEGDPKQVAAFLGAAGAPRNGVRTPGVKREDEATGGRRKPSTW